MNALLDFLVLEVVLVLLLCTDFLQVAAVIGAHAGQSRLLLCVVILLLLDVALLPDPPLLLEKEKKGGGEWDQSRIPQSTDPWLRSTGHNKVIEQLGCANVHKCKIDKKDKKRRCSVFIQMWLQWKYANKLNIFTDKCRCIQQIYKYILEYRLLKTLLLTKENVSPAPQKSY